MRKIERIEIREDAEVKASFERVADSRGTTMSHVLHNYILDYIDQENTSTTTEKTPEPRNKDPRWKVINTRLTTVEWNAVDKLIKEEGPSVTGWLLGLVRAKIYAGPQLRQEELLTVEKATYQLRSIGRNLNQMVRAVNQGKAETSQFSQHYAEQIQSHVKALADSLDSLIRSSTDRGIE